jgi:hypothetical protein
VRRALALAPVIAPMWFTTPAFAVAAHGTLADIGGPPVPGVTTLIALVIAGLVTIAVLVVSIMALRRIAVRVSRPSAQGQKGRRAVDADGDSSDSAPPVSLPEGDHR